MTTNFVRIVTSLALLSLGVAAEAYAQTKESSAQQRTGPTYALEGTVGTSSLMNKRGIALLIGVGIHASLDDNRLYLGSRMGASDDTFEVVFSYSDVQSIVFQTLWDGKSYKLDLGAGLGYYWYTEHAGSINENPISNFKFPVALEVLTSDIDDWGGGVRYEHMFLLGRASEFLLSVQVYIEL